MMKEKPLVSIVIPVYNGSGTIRECVKSMLSVNYPADLYEVIVVDDGSTDETAAIVSGFQDSRIKLLRREQGGPAEARNTGIKVAMGGMVVFTDADCIAPENWISNIVDEMQDSEGVVGGVLKPYSAETSSERFEQDRRRRLYGVEAGFRRHLPSCNLAVRREVLDEVGLFDTSFGSPSFEDYDLCDRITESGRNIKYSPKIEIIHKHAQSWNSVYRRAYLHGMNGVKFRMKHGKSKAVILSKLLLKIILLPAITMRRYDVRFYLHGLAYEVFDCAGVVKGLLEA